MIYEVIYHELDHNRIQVQYGRKLRSEIISNRVEQLRIKP